MDNNNFYLSIQDGKIINSNNERVLLRGVNLGGWVMMEGYILYGRNIPEKSFRFNLEKIYGRKEAASFTQAFRSFFITEDDFKKISDIGFNCVRIPFNFSLIEDDKNPFKYNEEGIGFLEKVLGWCEKYKIYCILDMHAAPGSQNKDWHSDSHGESYLWSKKIYKKRFFRLWEFIADRFKDRSIIAGYNVLNEPVVKKAPRDTLRNFYKEAVKYIRKADKNHIIFLEGNFWSRVLEDIGEPFADNLCYSVHYYDPLDFTHNFHKGFKYPGVIHGEYWDKERIRRDLEAYYSLTTKWNVPIFLGEFGVNSRCGKCDGELRWLKDVLQLCDEYDFHWTYWTYKAVANSIFPDGLYQYFPNPAWINRIGPIYGWENYYTLWKKYKKDIIISWETGNFRENKLLANLLTLFLKDK